MNRYHSKILQLFIYTVVCSSLVFAQQAEVKKPSKALRILLITGGCCHNYPFQTQALKEAVDKLKQAEWTIVNEGGTGTSATISLYNNAQWAEGFDVVIHNECFADTKELEYVQKIIKPHYKGVPAVVIHCAMHSYRALVSNDWRQFVGVTTRRHDPQSRYPVKVTEQKHSIVREVPSNWITAQDELYIIEKLWPDSKVLATSVSERDGKIHPVIWTHKYGKAKVFGTTFGHSDAAFKDPVFLHVVARGVLWAAGRLK